jgi:hypothetical protein
MKLQNDCDEVQFPEARGGQASSKGIPRGAHRQSGLRRELLQIASKKKFKQVIGLLRCQCSQAAITSSPTGPTRICSTLELPLPGSKATSRVGGSHRKLV